MRVETFAAMMVSAALALAAPAPAEAANFFKHPGRWFNDTGKAINKSAIKAGHYIEKHPVEVLVTAAAVAGGAYLIANGTPLTVTINRVPVLKVFVR